MPAKRRRTSLLLEAIGQNHDTAGPWFVFGDDPREYVPIQLDVFEGDPRVTIEGRASGDGEAEVIPLVSLLAPGVTAVPKMEQLRARVIDGSGSYVKVLSDKPRREFDEFQAALEQAIKEIATAYPAAVSMLAGVDPLDMSDEPEEDYSTIRGGFR